ncbi:pro-neuregulin-3, membrane-bound isoform-like isoform X2 [Solea senegalensis]|uniref:Pro-neuregulin-3, membrane-bound isoform-like isoform X2 n=1 Tax=Solea senegalensis TaxID=28829 RepID=A0AAV6S7H1_SOLSE|nr:pro-neuregulin-3, membrane-bound isoform isoform X2 [Solea senegalensis]KAG7512607.1 pro-neuregulin-3, membrane-bound isoform-like isoform X2 [Solea senegalensis]
MSECSGAAVSGVVILEEPEASGASGGRREGQAQDQGPLRCAVWPRQQTWLCMVPLLIGFIGLGLSLMLLKWIVVGTVRDYVPTDLVDANPMGQDPIFLSKPSGIPKGPDTTTTTTTTTIITPTADGGNPAARTVTVAKGRTRSTATTTTISSKGGGASGSQVTPRNPGNRNGRGPSGFTTTTGAARTTFRIGAATPSPSPPNPTVLHDSTQMWTPEHTTTTETVSTTLTTRTHGHRKTPSPTVPPLHSEHFKPCQEKDLAYCLNGGECFVIETLSGPHNHCKCREGYQGIRCDQFLPKTDSILSDPNHLGIEFMESKEVYKRQVLSITFIAMTISLLGTLCMALYCRNKRRREKLQAHLKESRSLKNYSANSQNALDVKTRSPNNNLQMHECCKRSAQARQGSVCESSLAHCDITTAAAPSGCSRATAKHSRSGSLSHSPDQKSRAAHWSAPRRTSPIPRGRLNPIGVSKYSGPAYQHLQEVDSTEKDVESQRRQMRGENLCDGPRQGALLHMQPPVAIETTSPSPYSSRRETSLGPRAPAEHNDSTHATRSLRRPLRRHTQSPPPPFRSCSIPIIPSVQCHHDNEASCMQTSATPAAAAAAAKSGPCKDERRGKATHVNLSSTSCSSTSGQHQDEVAVLLEEAQEQLMALALAHRKQEDVGIGCSGAAAARETVCFLNLNGGSAAALGCSGPTQTQLLSPSLSHRDLGHTGQ